jgi:hypothetical protein
VHALTSVATAATEDSLLMIPLYGTAHHLETLVRRGSSESRDVSAETFIDEATH